MFASVRAAAKVRTIDSRHRRHRRLRRRHAAHHRADVPDAVGCIYRISADETIDTLAGRYPAACFDHVDWPVSLGPAQGH